MKPNATYVVEVRPTMGAVKAAVKLYPVAPTDKKVLKRIKKLIAKKPPAELKDTGEDLAFFIKNGMDRYQRIQNKVKVIDSDWTF